MNIITVSCEYYVMKFQDAMANGTAVMPLPKEHSHTNGSSYGKGDRYTAAPNE